MKKIDDNTVLRIRVPKALYESIKKQLEKKKNIVSPQSKLNEDLASVGTIALGVAGGLAGLWAAAGVTKFLGRFASAFSERLAYRLESAAKEAAKGSKKEIVSGIVKKFESDTELKSMYSSLPPYSEKTKKERNAQLAKIATYIKSKLTPEEMQYFNDISSMLRTGDIKESGYMGTQYSSSEDMAVDMVKKGITEKKKKEVTKDKKEK